MPGPVYAKDCLGKIIFFNRKFDQVINEQLDQNIIEVKHMEEVFVSSNGEMRFYDSVKFPLRIFFTAKMVWW